MLRLIPPPCITSPADVQELKIALAAEIYPDIALFWQNDTGALVSALSGDAVLSGDFDRDELLSFLGITGMRSVFCDEKTADMLYPFWQGERLSVFAKQNGCNTRTEPACAPNSLEVYDFLKAGGFTLPDYPDFATDYCRKANRGALVCAFLPDRYAAVAQKCCGAALITGVVSCKKGMGTAAISELLKDSRIKTVFAAAKKELAPFYIKNGFKEVYKAAYLYNASPV